MEKKVAFVSGASRGIGQQTVFCFARAGYSVAVAYHQGREAASRTAEACRARGAPEAFLVPLDLADDESVKRAVADTVKRFGCINVLVNNAGVLVVKPLADLVFYEIDLHLRVNLEGLIKMTKTFLPYVSGAIVNVGSRLAYLPQKNLSVYVASKFGVRGFTKSLAKELPQLRVYAVHPGLTATRMGGNFGGMDPAKVAEVVFRAATGKYHRPSGSDINAWYEGLGFFGKSVFRAKQLIKILIGRT